MSPAARRVLILTPVVALAAAGVFFAVTQFDKPPPPKSPKARLVVLAVFDQLRGDYPGRWTPLYETNGFERFKKDGVWFADAHLPYAVTTTGPGHASISTGAPPSVHGIVENNWIDRRTGKLVYCATADRPYARVPANPDAGARGGKDADGGMSPERLLAPTVAEALADATGGKGRTFSLALKDRTAVMLGGKQPAGCYAFDPATGQFHTSAYYRDRPHPWVEVYNAGSRKPADRWFGRAWERAGDPVLYDKYAGPDDAPGEAGGPTGRVFPHQLGKLLLQPDRSYYSSLESSPFGNELVWELAKLCIDGEKLGQGDAPDLLCLGFSSNDLIGHAWGPDSHEALDAAVRTDKLLADVIDHLTKTVGPGKFAVVVTADHGVCPLPERSVKDNRDAVRFLAADELKPLGGVLDAAFGRYDAEPGKWVEHVDYPWVYLNRGLAARNGLPPGTIDAMADLTARWWVENRAVGEAALTSRELAGAPPEPFGRAATLSFRADRCGDVYLLHKAYSVPSAANLTGTTHGTPHPYDTHVALLAYGVEVPALGKKAERVNALIAAPLVCRALGIPPPAAASEPLPPGFPPP